MTTTVTLHPDIAEYIGDGSAHAADHMPLWAVSILDNIAEAKRLNWHAAYLSGATDAYRAVMRHRFKVRWGRVHGGSQLIDTWTGESPTFVREAEIRDQVRAANEHNADVFAARIDRDIAEGGL